MKIEQLKSEIGNKERKVSDLIRYIKTCNEGNPNYSLFLGAGCSVTSGIKSASELIEQWRKEICLNLFSKEFKRDDYDSEIAINYLKEKCSSWFDPRNEYASLFEKRFDLPRQRRAFIEQEVSDKKPSIGYAYLVNLVISCYFNTIFTTNFDDLLNEAFYLFSDQRPMTCAHDSSISSITITSRRPKIIKLHGDYLFDEIKSTLKETESLENNMRDKFIEFSKDFGLIVIGYSGNDRSIMDILFYLLKSDVYLKNGIYWCLRKGDNVNSELRKLLWKDRVYFIEIDGFDELLAELNYHLNASKLPLEPSIFSNKGNEIIKSILNNELLKTSKSEIILEDVKKLKEQKTSDLFREIMKTIDINEDGVNDNTRINTKLKMDKKGKKLSDAERIELFQLQEKMIRSQYPIIRDEINEILRRKREINVKFQTELLKIKSKCFINTGFPHEAIECYLEIEKLEGPSVGLYRTIIDLMQDLDKKALYINKMIELDPYYFRAYLEKARLLLEKYDSIIDPKSKPQKQEILDLFDQGIEKYPCLGNPCWYEKFNFIIEDNEIETRLDICKELIDKLKKQDPLDLDILLMETTLMKKNNVAADEILLFAKTIREKVSIKNKVNYELVILNLLEEYNKKEELKNQLKIIEDNYDIDANYLLKKAGILLRKFDELDEAILIIEDSLESEQQQESLRTLANFYLYKGRLEDAENIILKKLGTSNEDEIISLYEAKDDYKSALELLRKKRNSSPLDSGLILQESYFLLMTKEFQNAYEFCRKYLEYSNFTDSHLIINHEIASIKLKHKPNDERLQRANQADDLMVKAAVALLRGDKNLCFSFINKELEKNQTRKYLFRKWILFEPIREDPRFKSLYK